MASTRLENIAKANTHYWDRQRTKLAGVTKRAASSSGRSDTDQLRRLDKLNLTAKRERTRLSKRIGEARIVARKTENKKAE